MKFFSLLALAPLASAWPVSHSGPQAIYFLDNNPKGSSVVSLRVAPDGTISNPLRTSTGGKGMIGKTNTGAFVTAGRFTSSLPSDDPANHCVYLTRPSLLPGQHSGVW